MTFWTNRACCVAGEVLNCDIWTVATRAAVDLRADKVICMTLPKYQVCIASCPLSSEAV